MKLRDVQYACVKPDKPLGVTYLVILSNIDLGSRKKVGKVTLLRSAPGRSCEMRCVKTSSRQNVQLSCIWCLRERTAALFFVNHRLILYGGAIWSGLIGGGSWLAYSKSIASVKYTCRRQTSALVFRLTGSGVFPAGNVEVGHIGGRFSDILPNRFHVGDKLSLDSDWIPCSKGARGSKALAHSVVNSGIIWIGRKEWASSRRSLAG